MGFKKILPNFNVLYFFLLLFNISIFKSDQVNQLNVGALETTEPNIPGVEILKGIEGNTIDKRFIDEESYKIVSIITKEMIPQLFERFQHPKLSFAKETWKPKNCEKNKFWSILLVFDKRRDVEPPDAATLTMMLDDVFKIYRNISRVEYDFSKAIVERESVKIMICFQNVPGTSNQSTQTNSEGGKPESEGNNSEYKSSTSSPAEGYIIATEQEYVEKFIKEEILPIFETFYPSYKTESNITLVKQELDGACSTIIFDISFEVHGVRFSIELKKFVDKWLKKLPESYTHIMTACLLESGETANKNMLITIRLKVSKLKDNCKISKGAQNELCPPDEKEMITGPYLPEAWRPGVTSGVQLPSSNGHLPVSTFPTSLPPSRPQFPPLVSPPPSPLLPLPPPLLPLPPPMPPPLPPPLLAPPCFG